MLRITKIALTANLILALLFLYSNFSLWASVNSEYPYLTVSHWSPLGIVASHYYGNPYFTNSIVPELFLGWNFPFWIFFVAIAVNLCFIYKLSKIDKTIKN